MANTLTGLIEYIYESADTVSRELCGLIPAITLNSAADQVAKDQSVTYSIAPAPTNYDVAPANAIPALDQTTVGAGTMAITKVRANKFHWTGEDEKAVGQRGKAGITEGKFAQAFRALANEIEDDLAALYVNASRAYGTSGTTPFGTAGDFTDAAEVRRLLVDNGAPLNDMQLVLNSAAGASIRAKQAGAGVTNSDSFQRNGVLLDMHGMMLRESAKIKAHTKGAGTGYTINNGNTAVGSTTLTFDGATVNTTGIKAGDIITINASTLNKYVIKTGSTSTTGDIVIQDPGLMAAIANDQAVAILNSYSANLAFARSAIHLLTRLPLMPQGGDQADDVTIVQDPVSGLFFQVAMYKAYRAVLFEVAIAWGVKAVKPEHIAILQG